MSKQVKLVLILNNSNYLAWSKVMKTLLLLQGLWGYANGNIEELANNALNNAHTD
jgi:hypothetical protein